MPRASQKNIRLSELWPYAVTIFLGAFLLFQVQPMISKMILPWYGGSPSVWTTCMLFFQSLLVGGYAYAHLLAKIRSRRIQIGLHVVLLIAACLLLPVTPGENWKPDGSGNPATEILWLLLICAGLPYFLLSATGPLVQAWFSRAFGNASPYRLFALSNAGSLLALVSYPFFFEPQFPLDRQGIIWAAAFVVYAIACALVGWKANRADLVDQNAKNKVEKKEHDETNERYAKADSLLAGRPRLQIAAWILLPALASIALLAITNYVCQDIAVIPFLWIAPLSLYLLSFIICFERERWYSRRWYALLSMICILLISNMMLAPYLQGMYYDLPLKQLASRIDVQITVFLAALFLLCMICHGELATLKPEPSKLTSYYLAISIGGALGGLFVAIICPVIFNQFYELNLMLIGGFLLALVLFVRSEWSGWLASGLIRAVGVIAVLAGFIVIGWAQYENARGDAVKSTRNFYGTLRLRYPREDVRAIYSGRVVHGTQQTAPGLQKEPTLYYTRNSGVGRVLQTLAKDSEQSGDGLDVALVGLGAGTLAAYGTPRDRYYFFEINPAVIEMANNDFTFLRDCPAKTGIIPGDARLSLENFETNSLDVLVLDAFSGDGVPTHLLTREAFEMYLDKLRPDGVLCVHTSNLHLQLSKVIAGQANLHDLACRSVTTLVDFVASPELKFVENSSEWMVLHRDERFFEAPLLKPATKPWPGVAADELPVWTDRHCNVFEILIRP